MIKKGTPVVYNQGDGITRFGRFLMAVRYRKERRTDFLIDFGAFTKETQWVNSKDVEILT